MENNWIACVEAQEEQLERDLHRIGLAGLSDELLDQLLTVASALKAAGTVFENRLAVEIKNRRKAMWREEP